VQSNPHLGMMRQKGRGRACDWRPRRAIAPSNFTLVSRLSWLDFFQERRMQIVEVNGDVARAVVLLPVFPERQL
jgi:hypothetical protein